MIGHGIDLAEPHVLDSGFIQGHSWLNFTSQDFSRSSLGQTILSGRRDLSRDSLGLSTVFGFRIYQGQLLASLDLDSSDRIFFKGNS
jgi:hypothetical protein